MKTTLQRVLGFFSVILDYQFSGGHPTLLTMDDLDFEPEPEPDMKEDEVEMSNEQADALLDGPDEELQPA